MVKDALKFFHAYINEMIEVGGENLPRAVSTKLGTKLGNILKERGFTELEPTLKQIYKVLGAKTTINKLDENTYDVKLKYSSKFCPIGGQKNPKQDYQHELDEKDIIMEPQVFTNVKKDCDFD